MAVWTLGELEGASISLNYDVGTSRIQSVSVTNPRTSPVYVTLTDVEAMQTRTFTIPAGINRTVAVAGNIALRKKISSLRDRWDSIEVEIHT